MEEITNTNNCPPAGWETIGKFDLGKNLMTFCMECKRHLERRYLWIVGRPCPIVGRPRRRTVRDWRLLLTGKDCGHNLVVDKSKEIGAAQDFSILLFELPRGQWQFVAINHHTGGHKLKVCDASTVGKAKAIAFAEYDNGENDVAYVAALW